MSRTITSSQLTTCSLVKEGRAIRLEFLDSEEQRVAVEFPFDQAESIVMTLPQMLSKALQQHTRSPSSRYVFTLGRWSIERCDEKSLIVTMSTVDGFQVSFAIPFDACRALAWAIRQGGSSAAEGANAKEPERQLLN
jgi:hypothetical protein